MARGALFCASKIKSELIVIVQTKYSDFPIINQAAYLSDGIFVNRAVKDDPNEQESHHRLTNESVADTISITSVTMITLLFNSGYGVISDLGLTEFAPSCPVKSLGVMLAPEVPAVPPKSKEAPATDPSSCNNNYYVRFGCLTLMSPVR